MPTRRSGLAALAHRTALTMLRAVASGGAPPVAFVAPYVYSTFGLAMAGAVVSGGGIGFSCL